MPEPRDNPLHFMMQQIEQYTKMGIEISPYLSTIQSLGGKTPGEKYKELNRIVKEIVRDEQTIAYPKIEEVPGVQQLPAAIVPIVKVRVGNALKSSEAVMEALMSEDVPLINQAFRAKWFFEGSNEIVTAEYFVDNIMPVVSKRTRFGIIKALARGLRGYECKAEDFCRAFSGLYGLEAALPLLPACGEKYVREEITRSSILLPYSVLFDLYKKYPDVVIDLLRNSVKHQRCKQNRNPKFLTREIFTQFLPHLIRRHVDIFVELYNPRYDVKVGSTNAELFFKQAADVVVKNPKTFVELFDIKVICNKLTLQQFETFFANVLPDKKESFIVENAIKFMKFYPKEKREQLLTNTYKMKYGSELSFSRRRFRSYVDIHKHVSVALFEKLFIDAFPTTFGRVSIYDEDDLWIFFEIFKSLGFTKERKFELLDKASKLKQGESIFNDIFSLKKIHQLSKRNLVELLPPEKRESQVVKFLTTCEEKSDSYYAWYVVMPPKKSFVYFKEAIAKSSNKESRHEFIKYMAKSLLIDCNKDDLQEFLEYYNRRHKNEHPQLLYNLLSVFHQYDLSKFEKSHCKILIEILQRLDTKGELIHLSLSSVEIFFKAMMNVILIKLTQENYQSIDTEDEALSNKLFELVICLNFERRYKCKWIFLEDHYILNKETSKIEWSELKKRLTVQRYCFEKLMELVHQKYPFEHDFHQKINKIDEKKIENVITIIEEVHKFNQLIDMLKKFSDSHCNIKKLYVTDYPWIVAIIKKVLMQSRSYYRRCQLESKMSKYVPDLLDKYENNDNPNDTVEEKHDREIKTGQAVIKLNKNRSLVLDQLDDYLNKCRKRLEHNTKEGGAAARRFLLATKWHEDLPKRIVENCLRDVKAEGNLKVLGVMLEGEVFGKLVAPLAPQDATVDVECVDAKEHYALVKTLLPAMNLTSPPVPFNVILLFCQGDYVKLAAQALTNASERVTRSKIEIFAEQLIGKSVSVKKHGIRLFFEMATKNDLEMFVDRMWKKEKHLSIREMLATLVQKRFVDEPSADNWKLMQISIDAVTEKDDVPILVLTNVKKIKNQYTCEYITKLLRKIEQLSEPVEVTASGTVMSKSTWITDLLNNAALYSNTSELLTKDLILEIVQKYCFIEPSVATVDLLKAAESFAKNVFSNPFSTQYYKFCFTERNRKLHYTYKCNKVPRM